MEQKLSSDCCNFQKYLESTSNAITSIVKIYVDYLCDFEVIINLIWKRPLVKNLRQAKEIQNRDKYLK